MVEALQDLLRANKTPEARDKYEAINVLKDEIRRRQKGDVVSDLDRNSQPLLHIAADAAVAWIESFREYQPDEIQKVSTPT